MKFDLTMPYDKDLKEEEKQEIDSFIDSIYEQCKDNSKEITQLAMEASFALNAGKNRANELCRQGFFKNLWGNIRGKNRKIRGEIDRDFAVSQRAGIKMIQKLAEHNKLTFEMIKNINLKLNCLVNEIDEELNQIYLQMNEFMKQVMDNFIEMSDKMNKLESKVNIHDLVIFIKHHDINGVKFTDLNINEKFLYFISEFFLKNKHLYIESDLMNLRYVMKEIGIDSDDKVSLLSIYDTLMSNSSIANKFFKAFDKEKLNYIEDFTMPILGNIKKIEKLENEEKYIIDSVIEMSSKDRKEVILNLLKNYSYNNLNMDLEKENSYFDLSISILSEMKNIDNLIVDTENEDNNSDDNIKLIELPKYTRYEIALELSKESKNTDAVFYLLNKAKDEGLDTAELYQLIGKVNLALKKYDDAANNYKLSIEKGLNDYNNNYYAAMSLFFAKKYKEAEDYMIKALEIEPDNFEANLNLGVIYRVLENYNEAIKYYDKAIKINDKSDIAYINKAEATAKNKGDKNLIEGLLSIAISLKKEHEKYFKRNSQFMEDIYNRLYYVISFSKKEIEYGKLTSSEIFINGVVVGVNDFVQKILKN
ncbi:tetratricopeptide repeat protein [Brachyspira catarrhinii]|uniref:Tetratricopeptide repeat protein n=1 Tax=Brachyspira catarrhinii TaxID=2528966 RepID=A0ABY2TQH1_9SPIR|nr:tetratricopeptide repeat protein [Brachyspira catarrhinii]TKZ35103.1 tetratricopeptide repeat protein [Brachyspira catarrhinii]